MFAEKAPSYSAWKDVPTKPYSAKWQAAWVGSLEWFFQPRLIVTIIPALKVYGESKVAHDADCPHDALARLQVTH